MKWMSFARSLCPSSVSFSSSSAIFFFDREPVSLYVFAPDFYVAFSLPVQHSIFQLIPSISELVLLLLFPDKPAANHNRHIAVAYLCINFIPPPSIAIQLGMKPLHPPSSSPFSPFK